MAIEHCITHRISCWILSLALICMVSITANAIPAYPWPFEITQPDGSKLTITMQGDEHGFLAFTDDGFPIVQNAANGYYEYARLTTRGVECSGIIATDAKKRNAEIQEYLQQLDIPAITNFMAERRNQRRSIQKAASQFLVNDFPTMGRQRSLVILVEFSDTKFTSIEDPYTYYNNMLNQEGFTHENGANGSARDFYHDCSNGLFDPQFDVVGSIVLPRPLSYYGGDTSELLDTMVYQMVIDACEMADDDIDFSQYDLNNDGVVDNIYFFYAGFGQADSGMNSAIWPHAAKLSEDWHQQMPEHDGVRINRYATSNEIRYGTGSNFKPVGIGTFVHEFGHVLGLVDHYDTGYNGSFHPNTWDTMAAASYNDNQNTPPTFSAFERGELGWLDYVDITPSTSGLLPVKELLSSNLAYRLVVPNTDGCEFFVMENRQQQGWDRTLPGHGMLVWHIDQDKEIWQSNQANADPNHQRIDIVEADKIQTNLSYGGDPFPGMSHVTAYDFYSWVHENLFSFDFVEETDSTVNFILRGTDFKPQATTIEMTQVLGQTATFTWDAVDSGKSYLVTVEQVNDDGSTTIIGEFDRKEYNQPEMVTITGLTPLTDYRVTILSQIGTYLSEPAVFDFTTTDIKFVETAPIATEATDITATGFTAHWQALEGASTYALTVYKNEYSDVNSEAYGFDDKAEGMPTNWTTSSTQYSQTMFGETKPSLQLTKQDDYLAFAYPGSRIMSLSFWQRSQMTTNQLVVETRNATDEEWSVAMSVKMSNKGDVVALDIDSAAMVRIRFERKGSYALIDDVEVSYITHNQNPVEHFVDLEASENLQLVISGLPLAENYVYRVRGLQGNQSSAESNSILVAMGHAVTGDVTGDGVVDIADVNAVVNMMLGKTEQTSASDVTGDGQIDIADVNIIINLMLGK